MLFRCKEAALLQGTVRLDKGTKVVYLSIGDLMDETMKAGTTSFAFTMTTPGLGFVLEDDYQVSCARRATDVGRNAVF